MTITVPQNKSTDFVSGSQATLAVSFTSGIAAGSIIAVAGSFSTAVSLSGVADGKGDTFTTIFAPFTDGSTGSTNFFGVFLAPTTGAITITATYSGNATFGDLFIWEIAGLTNPTVDTAKVRTLTANGSTFASGSTGTLSASAAALITYAVSAQGIASFNTPWTLDSITAHTASGGAHEVVAANTAQTSTGSNTVSAIDVVYVVPFYSGAAAAPFQPSDFPNPKPRPVPQENRGFIVDLNPALVGGGVKPFLQSDWPNPRGYVSYPENRTFTRPGNALIGGGVKPFAQTDWPNPKAYPRPTENRTFLFEGNALLLGIGAVQAPFNQLDWPNPRAYPVPQENRGFVQDLNPALYGGGVEPFAQTDWPNPKGYPVPQENRGFVKPLDLELVGGGVAPFTPYDWPNPQGRPVPLENRGFLSETNLNLLGGAIEQPLIARQIKRGRRRRSPRWEEPETIAPVAAEPPSEPAPDHSGFVPTTYADGIVSALGARLDDLQRRYSAKSEQVRQRQAKEARTREARALLAAARRDVQAARQTVQAARNTAELARQEAERRKALARRKRQIARSNRAALRLMMMQAFDDE